MICIKLVRNRVGVMTFALAVKGTAVVVVGQCRSPANAWFIYVTVHVGVVTIVLFVNLPNCYITVKSLTCEHSLLQYAALYLPNIPFNKGRITRFAINISSSCKSVVYNFLRLTLFIDYVGVPGISVSANI